VAVGQQVVVDGVTNGLSYETDSCGVQNVVYEWLVYEWLVCSEIVKCGVTWLLGSQYDHSNNQY